MAEFRQFCESSLSDLYQSAVDAFPRTTKRQHAVDPVRIIGMNWTPFVGLKTLLVRGNAHNEGKDYKTMILFKNVNYTDGPGVTLWVDGQRYFIERLNPDAQDVLLRCDCPDFYWRFNYYNHVDKSLYGRKRAPYRGQGLWEANPLELPGMCKHVMKTMTALRDAGVLLS